MPFKFNPLTGKLDLVNTSTGGAGSGDMTKAVYDPTNKVADAFSMGNMVETAGAKIMTAAERTLLANQSGTNTGDQNLSGLVPYTGATSNIDINTKTLSIGATSAGMKFYNTADQTTNVENISMGFSGNAGYISSNSLGAGTVRSLTIGASTGVGQTIGNHRIAFSPGSPAAKISVGGTDTGATILEIGTFSGGLGSNSIVQKTLDLTTPIAQSGTAGYTMLSINPTETSTGSGAKRLISAQLASADKFVVDNTGAVTAAGTITGSNLSGTNTGDQTMDGILPNKVGNALKVLRVNASETTYELASASAGSVSISQATLSLPYAKKSHTVTVTDASVNSSTRIMASLAGMAETEENGGSTDLLSINTYSKSGSFDVFLEFMSPAGGALKLNYLIA